MDALALPEFAAILGGRLTGEPPPQAGVRHVTTHSDRIHSGSAFFALTGSRTDGHRFARAAIRNGAVAAVVSSAWARSGDGGGGPLVEVDDPLLALQRLAGWWRGQVGARVVAVVGSNGK